MSFATLPEVSVVIPTRNRATDLLRALGSVWTQTFRDLELIVVDDASTDATFDLMRGMRERRLRYVRLAKCKGAAAARNTGIRLARGRFVALLDDDDEWLPNKMERMVNAIEESSPDVGVISCRHRVVSEISGRTVTTSEPRTAPESAREFLRSTGFMTSVPLIRRSCFETVGLFDESLPGSQDRDLWIRLAERFTFRHVPEVLTVYRVHGRQITSDLRKKVVAKQMLLRKYAVRLADDHQLFGSHLARLGLLKCAASDDSTGRALLRRAMRFMDDTRELREQLYLSRHDPVDHRRILRETVFTQIDGISMYY